MTKYFNLNAKTWLAIGILASPFCLSNAQVTVGMGETPEKAALLQLKDKASAPNSKDANATSGGLLLPRVELNGIRDFTLISNATDAQKNDHTGMLVYNQRVEPNLQLEKGVYQWSGTKWKMLQKTTRTDGLSVKKAIYPAKSPDPDQILSIGIFEFRIGTNAHGRRASQFRLLKGVPDMTVYLLINWDQDDNVAGESYGWWQPNNPLYYFGVKTYTGQSSAWSDIAEWEKNAEKHEVWLSDLNNDNIYHVRFLSFGSDDADSDKIYGVIGQKY
jgi:hypothetical protein